MTPERATGLSKEETYLPRLCLPGLHRGVMGWVMEACNLESRKEGWSGWGPIASPSAPPCCGFPPQGLSLAGQEAALHPQLHPHEPVRVLHAEGHLGLHQGLDPVRGAGQQPLLHLHRECPARDIPGRPRSGAFPQVNTLCQWAERSRSDHQATGSQGRPCLRPLPGPRHLRALGRAVGGQVERPGPTWLGCAQAHRGLASAGYRPPRTEPKGCGPASS